MPVVMVDDVRASDQARELRLRLGRDQAITVRPHDCSGNIDVADPITRIEPPNAARRFREHADVVPAHLVGCPLQEPGRSVHVDAPQQVRAGRRYRSQLTGHARETRYGAEVRVGERTGADVELGCRCFKALKMSTTLLRSMV